MRNPGVDDVLAELVKEFPAVFRENTPEGRVSNEGRPFATALLESVNDWPGDVLQQVQVFRFDLSRKGLRIEWSLTGRNGPRQVYQSAPPEIYPAFIEAVGWWDSVTRALNHH